MFSIFSEMAMSDEEYDDDDEDGVMMRGECVYLGGEQAGQVDLWEDLLTVALPVGLPVLHRLIIRQDLGVRGQVRDTPQTS